MGKRGPSTGKAKHAKSIAKPAWTTKLPPWEQRGLTRAERVCRFLEVLPITAGKLAGQRLKLRPWQREMIEAIYATDDDGNRVVRTAVISMGRKNGKTQLAAGLALCHLIGPEAEQRGQVLSAASDREQAAIIFRELEAYIFSIPEFSSRCNIRAFHKEIDDAVTGSTYRALSSDARKAHGLSPSFIVYDELAQSKNRELFDNLVTGTGARAEPLTVVISTQSSDPHHVLSELIDYGTKVQDGSLPPDPTFHLSLFMTPEDADPWDEGNWYASNPALGDFRSLEQLRRDAEQAKRIPAREATFRALYLNQRVDADQRFISSVDWDACNGPVDLDTLRGRPCYGGLDLSATTDLTALVLYFPEDNGAVLAWHWIPGDGLDEREDKDRVPYRAWVKQGLIETTPGRVIHKGFIAARLADVASRFDVRGIAYDRWGMPELQRILGDEGISLPLEPWGQGYKDMGPAVDALETAVLSQGIRHGGNPVLRWQASNAVVTMDPAGSRKLAKDRAVQRIDGIVALAMALGLASRAPAPVEYDFSGGILLL
ncbi:MAG: terminase large subunit [Desulfovibrio sp.]|nr:terminase large subunit [Desulfovibrio sp.]